MYGVWRTPSFGPPAPPCPEGWGKRRLGPPPPAERSPELSFHTRSGMYESAEPLLALLAAAQYAPPCSLNSVPPIAVTSGIEAGASTEKPFCAMLPFISSQSA